MDSRRDLLTAHLGEAVIADFIWNGVGYSITGRLESVNDDGTVGIGNAVVPFDSERAAIRRITNLKGELLLDNPEVKPSHGWRDRSLREMLTDRSVQPIIRREGLIFPSVGGSSFVYKVVLTAAEPLEMGRQGGWIARVPLIKGCVSYGDDEEEALKNVKDAALLCLKEMKERGEQIPLENLT